MYSLVLRKDLNSVFCIMISPKPRININNINPIMMYVNKMKGRLMQSFRPAPKNKPVPIAPPIAINCMWRLLHSPL